MKNFFLLILIFLSTQIFAASDKTASGTAHAVSGAEAGASNRKGQTDPSDKHSWVGSRARGSALQTDKLQHGPGYSTEITSGTVSGSVKTKH